MSAPIQFQQLAEARRAALEARARLEACRSHPGSDRHLSLLTRADSARARYVRLLRQFTTEQAA